MSRRQNIWPIATLVFGCATLGVFVAFNLLPAVRAVYPAGELPEAVSAFQRARSLGDLAAVFGDPPHAAITAAMDAVNTLDLYAFVPAYSLFLIAAALMLAGGVRAPLAWLAIVPALIGAGADMVETSAQLRLTADWANAEAYLPRIAPAHWVKYFALAAHALGCTAIGLLAPAKRWIVAMLGFAPLAGVFAAWTGAPPSLMSAAISLYWIALLVVAFIELARADKRAKPPQSHPA